MRKVFEDKFLKKYAKNTPQEIIEAEGRKALAVISQIRDESRKEDLRLKAALAYVDRFVPAGQKVEHTGGLTITIEKKVVHGDSE